MNLGGRRICVNEVLYLKEFSIDNDFNINIVLTNYEKQGEQYPVENIEKILQILVILGFKNPVATL